MIERIKSDILYNMDRNPYSASYGCLDKEYWHYRMVREFPSTVYQSAALALALIFKTTGDRELLPHIRAGMDFWQKQQNRDGSFAEWYRNERSIVATAFTLCAMIEALEAAGDEIDRKVYIGTFKKAADFLINNKEYFVQNHAAGAAAACYKLHCLTGEEKYKDAYIRMLNEMDAERSKEGWFYEYGGFDYGYHSVSMYYLSKIDCELSRKLLTEAAQFLTKVLPEDSVVPFSLGSRNTGYLLSSLKNLGFDIKPAEPFFADARYRFLFFYNDILSDCPSKGDDKTGKNSGRGPFTFKEAGLIIREKGPYKVYINFKKNGNYAVTENKITTVIDNGIIFKTADRCYISSFLNENGAFSETGDEIVITGALLPLQTSKWQPSALLLFKLFNSTVGNFAGASITLDRFMKSCLVRGQASRRIPFKRRIKLSEKGVVCENIIDVKGDIYAAPAFSFSFSPTANLFYGD